MRVIIYSTTVLYSLGGTITSSPRNELFELVLLRYTYCYTKNIAISTPVYVK